MWGLVGYLSANNQHQDNLTIINMINTIKSRGPDDSGYGIDTSSEISLGHRRLAVVDFHPSGHQSMHFVCSRYVIAFIQS